MVRRSGRRNERLDRGCRLAYATTWALTFPSTKYAALTSSLAAVAAVAPPSDSGSSTTNSRSPRTEQRSYRSCQCPFFLGSGTWSRSHYGLSSSIDGNDATHVRLWFVSHARGVHQYGLAATIRRRHARLVLAEGEFGHPKGDGQRYAVPESRSRQGGADSTCPAPAGAALEWSAATTSRSSKPSPTR